jgi:hypothetical protein
METSMQPIESGPTSGNEGPVRERELDVLRQLSGEGGQFRDRIDEYVALSAQLVDAIQKSLAAKDAPAVERDACALKAASAQLGAHRVSGESEAIESAAKKGDLKAAKARLRALTENNEAAIKKLLTIEASPFP